VDGVAPLDAALGLPDEKYSHQLRRIVAEESAKSSFDEVAELIVTHTGARVPKRKAAEETPRRFDTRLRAVIDRHCDAPSRGRPSSGADSMHDRAFRCNDSPLHRDPNTPVLAPRHCDLH
jgi:hypothetical protein